MRTLFALFGLAVVLSTAACGGQQANRAEYEGTLVCHPDKMEAAEEAARRSSFKLHWVHCPRAAWRNS